MLLTHKAVQDLSAATGYIEHTLSSPSAAQGLLDAFEKLLGQLETMPEAHSFMRDDLLAYAGYRWAPFGSYLAFFIVDAENQEVVIERIAHESRDWKALLGQ
ncbi:MAG: type II toxin-antitoxin system RelE/ParE family toxin [Eggerthellaceae bacterium]|nr:type II toxin-antitoxin system RelE/ParE family toxin [Eggerthellaceae bacterium]